MIIEVDGGQHAEDANYDSVRDGWFENADLLSYDFGITKY